MYAANKTENEVNLLSGGVFFCTSPNTCESVMINVGGFLSAASAASIVSGVQPTATQSSSSNARIVCTCGRIILPFGADSSMGVTKITMSEALSLTPLDIVAEKLVSAFLSVSVIIISCLPAMLVPLLYGGVPVQSAAGLLLLFIPEAFVMLSVGMFASSLSHSVVRSTVLAYGIALGLGIGTILLALLARPFGIDGGNRAAYLLTLNPLFPVFSVVMKQTGEAGAAGRILELLGLAADRAYLEHTVLISLACQLAMAFGLLVLSVLFIIPGRRRFLPRAGREGRKNSRRQE